MLSVGHEDVATQRGSNAPLWADAKATGETRCDDERRTMIPGCHRRQMTQTEVRLPTRRNIAWGFRCLYLRQAGQLISTGRVDVLASDVKKGRSIIMKYSLLALAAVSLDVVAAFPRMDAGQLKTYQRAVEDSAQQGCPYAKKSQQDKRATFNAERQRVSVDGQHAFRAPDFDAGDQRGKPPVPIRPSPAALLLTMSSPRV
jgi:hypothetical protein